MSSVAFGFLLALRMPTFASGSVLCTASTHCSTSLDVCTSTMVRPPSCDAMAKNVNVLPSPHPACNTASLTFWLVNISTTV